MIRRRFLAAALAGAALLVERAARAAATEPVPCAAPPEPPEPPVPQDFEWNEDAGPFYLDGLQPDTAYDVYWRSLAELDARRPDRIGRTLIVGIRP
jgi:hypothetical protein